MKKFYVGLVSFIAVISLLLPLSAQASCASVDRSLNTYGAASLNLPHYCTTTDIITKVINIAMALIGSVTIVYIIIGGYQYMTARDKPDAKKKAKKTITYAVAGLAIVILAVAIVNLVVNFVIST